MWNRDDNIEKLYLKKNIKIFKTDKEPILAVAEFVVGQIISTLKILIPIIPLLKNLSGKNLKEEC